MKNEVFEQFNIEKDKISVIKPNITNLKKIKIERINLENSRFHIFYPASSAIYKNHKIIFEALNNIKRDNNSLYEKIILHLTLDNDNYATNLPIFKKIEDKINLMGKIKFERVLSFYKESDLIVFPSFIETFGLPLLEAAQFGKEILSSDTRFAKEVLEKYDGVKYIAYNDPKSWADKIVKTYKNKKDYSPYIPDYNTSWKDFFDLLHRMVLNGGD